MKQKLSFPTKTCEDRKRDGPISERRLEDSGKIISTGVRNEEFRFPVS